MQLSRKSCIVMGMAALSAMIFASDLRAELRLETMVVELNDDDPGVEDVEVFNDGSERMFVSIEPARISDPGGTHARLEFSDPEELGLLASPSKMILEPGQRKLIRLASFSNAVAEEQIYRVLVRPVPAPDTPEESGLAIMVGYDILVLVRPDVVDRGLEGVIKDGSLHLRNNGNASVELISGQQCEMGSDDCDDLPGKRLYVGQQFSLPLDGVAPVRYLARFADGVAEVEFSAAQ